MSIPPIKDGTISHEVFMEDILGFLLPQIDLSKIEKEEQVVNRQFNKEED